MFFNPTYNYRALLLCYGVLTFTYNALKLNFKIVFFYRFMTYDIFFFIISFKTGCIHWLNFCKIRSSNYVEKSIDAPKQKKNQKFQSKI